MRITLRENNLYARGQILEFKGSVEKLLTRKLIEFPGTVLDKYHTVKDQDRLDKLAFQYYKKHVSDASKYWWIIADANEIDNPLDLSDWVGEKLLIPDFLQARLVL